jgi:hypothetical protein
LIIFDELLKQTEFEDINNGRQGAVLVDYKNDLIPIVRTTSTYTKPVQQFSKIHYNIMENIKRATENNKLHFNNALIEIYDSKYCSMGEHTDQAQDLNPESFIAVFSCYKNPATKDIRKLKVKDKATGKLTEYSMDHNSVILFSTATNSENVHKIVLEKVTTDEIWLGITFRLSKTFIRFVNELSYFYPTDRVLRPATKEERNEFYKLRSNENKLIRYVYPELDYTISVSDLMPIK